MKKIDDTDVQDDMEKPELWYIAGESIKWYSHFGRQSGSLLKS